MDPLALLAKVVQPAPLVHLVKKDLQALPDQLALLVLPARRDPLVPKDLPEVPDPLDQPAPWDQLVQLVQAELLDPPVQLVQLVAAA